MKVLQSIRNKFILLWFCSSDYENSFEKFRNKGFLVSLFVGMICSASACATYISNNFENDLEGCLFATMIILGELALIIMMISAILLRNNISEVFSDYQDFYDKCK